MPKGKQRKETRKKGKRREVVVRFLTFSILLLSLVEISSSSLPLLSPSSSESSSRRLLIYQRWFRVRSSFQFVPPTPGFDHRPNPYSPSARIPVTPLSSLYSFTTPPFSPRPPVENSRKLANASSIRGKG